MGFNSGFKGLIQSECTVLQIIVIPLVWNMSLFYMNFLLTLDIVKFRATRSCSTFLSSFCSQHRRTFSTHIWVCLPSTNFFANSALMPAVSPCFTRCNYLWKGVIIRCCLWSSQHLSAARSFALSSTTVAVPCWHFTFLSILLMLPPVFMFSTFHVFYVSTS
jgi:hypothetical protein